MKFSIVALGFFVSILPTNAFQSIVAPRYVGSKQVASSFSTQLYASQITMPALSSTMKEGRVVTWLKNEGDEISAGEAIMVVESDKADMDVEAFEDGYLAKIVVAEGEMAPVGQAVALIAESEADIPNVIASYNGGSAATAAPAAVAEGMYTFADFENYSVNNSVSMFAYTLSLFLCAFPFYKSCSDSCFIKTRLRIQSN